MDLLSESIYDKNNDAPEHNSGLSTLAAFCDHDAAVNDDELPTDDPDECIESLADSPVRDVVGWARSRPHQPRVIGPSRATFTTVYACPHKDSPLRLTWTLTRGDDSRHPNCWLISTITRAVHSDTS